MIFGGIDPATGILHVLQGKTLYIDLRRRGRSIHTVTLGGAPTGGQFQLIVRGGTTPAIPWDATAAEMQALLETVATVGVGNVHVTGGPGPDIPWTVEYVGRFAGARVPAMTTTGVALTGGSEPTVSCAVASPGGPMFTGGNWTAKCQLRAGYADTDSTVLASFDCTVSPLTGRIWGELSDTVTDAITIDGGRYEVEAYNSATDEVAQPYQNTWTLHRTVVRS